MRLLTFINISAVIVLKVSFILNFHVFRYRGWLFIYNIYNITRQSQLELSLGTSLASELALPSQSAFAETSDLATELLFVRGGQALHRVENTYL